MLHDITPRLRRNVSTIRVVQASIRIRAYGVFKKQRFQFPRTPDTCGRRMKADKGVTFSKLSGNMWIGSRASCLLEPCMEETKT